MGRIEEIKEFIAKCKSDPVRHKNTFMVHGPSDIEYLLSKLDIAEKALEEAKDKTALAVNKMSGGTVDRHIFEDTRAAYYSIRDALEQIRS